MKTQVSKLTTTLFIITFFLSVGLQATSFSEELSSVIVNSFENSVMIEESPGKNKTEEISKSEAENVEPEFDIKTIIFDEPEVDDLEIDIKAVF